MAIHPFNPSPVRPEQTGYSGGVDLMGSFMRGLKQSYIPRNQSEDLLAKMLKNKITGVEAKYAEPKTMADLLAKQYENEYAGKSMQDRLSALSLGNESTGLSNQYNRESMPDRVLGNQLVNQGRNLENEYAGIKNKYAERNQEEDLGAKVKENEAAGYRNLYMPYQLSQGLKKSQLDNQILGINADYAEANKTVDLKAKKLANEYQKAKNVIENSNASVAGKLAKIQVLNANLETAKSELDRQKKEIDVKHQDSLKRSELKTAQLSQDKATMENAQYPEMLQAGLTASTLANQKTGLDIQKAQTLQSLSDKDPNMVVGGDYAQLGAATNRINALQNGEIQEPTGAVQVGEEQPATPAEIKKINPKDITANKKQYAIDMLKSFSSNKAQGKKSGTGASTTPLGKAEEEAATALRIYGPKHSRTIRAENYRDGLARGKPSATTTDLEKKEEYARRMEATKGYNSTEAINARAAIVLAVTPKSTAGSGAQTPFLKLIHDRDKLKNDPLYGPNSNEYKVAQGKVEDEMKSKDYVPNTTTVKTKMQNIINGVPIMIRGIDKLIGIGYGVTTLSPAIIAKQNAQVTSMADTYAATHGWPNTLGAITKVEKILAKGVGETTKQYHERLRSEQKEMLLHSKDSQDILRYGTNISGKEEKAAFNPEDYDIPEDTVPMFKEGKVYFIPKGKTEEFKAKKGLTYG